MLKLAKKNNENIICVNKMEDGQVAEIIPTKLGFDERYSGRIVQLFGHKVISLGLPNGNSWSNLFGSKNGEIFMVRIIGDDETFTIKNNSNPSS